MNAGTDGVGDSADLSQGDFSSDGVPKDGRRHHNVARNLNEHRDGQSLLSIRFRLLGLTC